MLTAFGAAIEADRTLGGLCLYAELEAPVTDDIEATGAVSARWADCAVLASYTTASPL
jgi:hypothetical protein